MSFVTSLASRNYRSQIELLDFAALELLLKSFSGDHFYYLRTSWQFRIHIHIALAYRYLASINLDISEFQSCEVDLVLSEEGHPNNSIKLWDGK